MTPQRRAAAAHVLVDALGIEGESVVLGDRDAHRLTRVLRLRDGAIVTITDGHGRWRTTTIADTAGGAVTLHATAPVEEEPPPAPLELAVAIPKGDRLDWLVQKVTELGATRLVLLHADRAVVRWTPDRAERHLARLRRISDEALRQSRRVWQMTIDGPVDSASVLRGVVVAEPGGRDLRPDDRRIAIGPEGGWSPAELDVAAEQVDLGPAILRTETAAVAVAARSVAEDR